VVDERFLMHRLRSTSLAGVAGGVLGGVLFLYQHWARRTTRWDLLAVLVVMAVVKVAAMLYYRSRD
jgi:hypothetical protein